MIDNHSEGRPGERINETISYSAAALAQQPNVILLHVGSNDLVWDDDVPNAPARLRVVLERLFNDCPEALVLIAMLGPSTNDYYQARMDAFNRMLPRLEGYFKAKGYRIMLVNAPSNINTSEDLFDDIHPNDVGYQKMGHEFAKTVLAALAKGWVSDPIDVSLPVLPPIPHSRCAQNPTWAPLGRLATGESPDFPSPNRPLLVFGDFNSDGRDDYLIFRHNTLQPYLNLGPPTPEDISGPPLTWLPLPTITLPFVLDLAAPAPVVTQLDPSLPPLILLPRRDGFVDGYTLVAPPNPLAVPFTVIPRGPVVPALAPDGTGVRFADVDGDGRPDYLYLHGDGAVSAWLNRAHPSTTSSHSHSDPAATRPEDLTKRSPPHGAGRANAYKPLESEANAATPLQQATESVAPTWLPLGRIFAPPPLAPHLLAGEIIFQGLDGDGRADALLVTRDGAVRAWANRGPGTPARGEWRGSGGLSGPGGAPVEVDLVVDEAGLVKRGIEAVVESPDGDRRRWHRHAHKDCNEPAQLPQDSNMLAYSEGSQPAPTIIEAAGDSISAFALSAQTAPLSSIDTLLASVSPFAKAAEPSAGRKKQPKKQSGSQEPRLQGLKDFLQGPRPPSGSIPMAQPVSPVAGWMWEDRGNVASGVGVDAEWLTRFADLDGDGRAEYLVTSPSGEVWGWRNGCE